MNGHIIVLLALIVAIFSPAGVSAPVDKEYTFGVVPQFEPRKIHAIWRPILDEIEKKTGFSIKLRGSTSIVNFEREFSQGEFDFAYMNPYHLLVANEQAGYKPLVRDVGRQLYGVLVVRADSKITSPSQLSGSQIAFPSPNALGASMLIRKDLSDDFGIKIRPVYVRTHDSVYLNVLLGDVAAGGGVQKTLERQREESQKRLRVIHTTKRVAPHPVVVLPSIPEQDSLALQKAFLELGQSEDGKKLLTKVPVKKIGIAVLDDYASLSKMGLQRFYVGHD